MNRRGRDARLTPLLAALAAAFIACHAALFTHPAGYFAHLGADEIREVLLPQRAIRAGELPVLSASPPGKPDGGGILQAYLLAPFALDDPRVATRAVRAGALALALATLLCWSATWWRARGPRAAALAALLLLFPGEGWTTNVTQAFGSYGPGAFGAAFAALATVTWRGGRRDPRASAALGALLGSLGLVLPASGPVVAGAGLIAAVHLVSRRSRALVALVAAGILAVLAWLGLEALATGRSPWGLVVGFVWRPETQVATSFATLARVGLRGLLDPDRVWLMPAWQWFGLLGLALLGLLASPTAPRRADQAGARFLAAIEGVAVAAFALVHMTTRFASAAPYDAPAILPPLVGLAALPLAAAWESRGRARLAAAAFVVLWVTGGLGAQRERFAVDTPDLRYAAVLAPRLAAALQARETRRIATTYQLGYPARLWQPRLEICCLERSLCAEAEWCAPGWFAGGPGTFVVPGPAAHLHGEPEDAALAGRLLAGEGSRRTDGADDGRRVTALVPATDRAALEEIAGAVPDRAVAVVVSADDGDAALAALLEQLRP